ncbi:MAG: SRPBCC family protein [Longimicrobiales bacterium]
MTSTLEVTLPSDQEVVVTREFNAPRILIWDAHTKPELVKRWMLGLDGWSMSVCDIDLRVGGGYRWRWRSDADGQECGFRGEYKEIAAPGRLVHTERFDGPDEWAMGDSLSTLTLTEKNGRTKLTYLMTYPSKEIRDQAVGTGMTDGMATSYDRLEREIVEKSAA